jgi:glycine/D-amino acid oxidase-like deaminating enzyme
MQAMPDRADVVVVGGGIVGTSCAFYLARAGCKVLLVDKESKLAGEGSGLSFGSIRLQGRHPLEVPLALKAIELWQEAARAEQFDFVQGGNMYVADTPAELSELESHLHTAQSHGLSDVQLLKADQAREVIPALAGEFAGALYSPRDAHADPPRAVQAFWRLAERSGGRLALGTKVTQVLVSNGNVTGVQTDRGPIQASTVVIAAGIWAPHLVRPLGLSLPLKPVASTQAETSKIPPVFRATLRGFGFSARQRPDGSLVLGAGLNATVIRPVSLEDLKDVRVWLRRYVHHRRDIDMRLDTRSTFRQLRHLSIVGPAAVPTEGPLPRPRRAMLQKALSVLQTKSPATRSAQITRFWTGLIDQTPDGLPVIERLPTPRGLVVVAGLSGHGFAIGPALGHVGAELATNGRSQVPLDGFELARFEAQHLAMPYRMV